jgi:hypothetical protein
MGCGATDDDLEAIRIDSVPKTFEIFGTMNTCVDCGILRCTTGECHRRL